jgi:predicted SAM-dependent methyltransferase
MGIVSTLARTLPRSRRRDILRLKSALSVAVGGALRQLTMGKSLGRHCKGKSGLRLNIGCGPFRPEGWVNIDYMGDGRTAFYLDARDPLPIESGTVSHIHCEHFLEHVEFDEAERFIAECFRVLSADGTLRLIVPDLETYINAYTRDDRAFFDSLAHLGGHEPRLETPAMVINQMARMWNDHRFAWDFETLSLVLKRAGFTRVERSELGAGLAEHAIDLTDWWRPVESVYLNVWK